MKTILPSMILILSLITTVGQSISSPVKDTGVTHIILANPTARNVEIVRFLIENKIFKVNTNKVSFVGVYHRGQSYDFEISRKYIRENQLSWITLQEVEGELSTADLYTTNACTPVFRGLFDRSSGVIFFGGPDIQPETYGEENQYSDVTDPMRHLFELSFGFHLMGSSRNPEFRPFLEERPGYLVTGFCLGLQTMNVAAGGSLWQDIPAQIYNKYTPQETVETGRGNIHRNYWQLFNKDEQLMTINLHPIIFTEHPFFGKSVKVRKKEQPRVYSSHHQSPKAPGMGFEITALSPDRIVIEGMAHNRYPHVFAVQFHPEVPALFKDMESWKFEPGDEPRTMHQMIGKDGVRFHKRYWSYISGIVNSF